MTQVPDPSAVIAAAREFVDGYYAGTSFAVAVLSDALAAYDREAAALRAANQFRVSIRAPARGATPWTPTLDARLRAEWATGTSASEIGRRLGVSKNAVIGRAHRLYLPPRPSAIRRKGEPSPPRPPRPPKPPTVAYVPSRPARQVARECQYLTSKAKPWRFCGAPCITGRSWCAEHARRVHRPTLRQSTPAPE